MAETNILTEIESKISNLKDAGTHTNFGTITEMGDGVARTDGLSQAMYNEIIKFPHSLFGIALNLEETSVGVVVLGDYRLLKEGDRAETTGQILSIPVGEAYLGRTVDALGEAVDGLGEIKSRTRYPLEKVAPGVITRESVNTPVQTGIVAIDALIPIGRGQRELIIGDRGLGKTAIAIDTIINQKGKDLICIYVAVGQKTAKVAQVIDTLEKYGALEHTIIVAATAADSAAMQYLAPYAGTAIGEYFMDKGQEVLIVYDDLTKHAWAYRQISLLLRRPSGREAYPGDVFYLHSRLLERSGKLNKKFGGGSMTALPIIETQAGDVSAYIPTNVISISDGQIYLEADLFNAGQRPAVNVGISVSRVGGAAQIKAMRKASGGLKLDLAQYRELAAFAQFGSDLDEQTRKRLDRGKRLSEILKQPQYRPIAVGLQVAIIYAATNGYLDEVEVDKIDTFKEDLFGFLANKHKKLIEEIEDKKELSDDLKEKLDQAIAEFKKDFS